MRGLFNAYHEPLSPNDGACLTCMLNRYCQLLQRVYGSFWGWALQGAGLAFKLSNSQTFELETRRIFATFL